MQLVNFQFNGSNMSDRVEMWLIKRACKVSDAKKKHWRNILQLIS